MKEIRDSKDFPMVLDILHISLRLEGREGKEGVREDRTKERRSMPKSTLKPWSFVKPDPAGSLWSVCDPWSWES